MSRVGVQRFQGVLLHVLFFLSGTATVLIGQVLPNLENRFSLNDLQLGYFFPAQFAGSLIGTLLTSLLARRDNYQLAATVGGMLMAIGVVVMSTNSFSVCLVGFFVNGLGIGLTLPAINMLILEANPERPGSALSILNFCWGLGAIVSKPFVDLTSTPIDIGLTTYLIAVPLALVSLLLFVSGGRRAPVAVLQEVSEPSDDLPVWTMPMAWAIALFNFMHVGFESGMGGWLTTYTTRLEGGPAIHWLSPTLLYFSFFVIGRGVAPLLFRFVSENRMIFLGLSIIFSGMVVILYTGTPALLSTGAVLAGFGTSWIFPTNVARFSRVFGPSAKRRATPLFICGTLGAASSTWLIGFISNESGNLRWGMWVLIICVVLLIGLQMVLSLQKAVHR